jgi:polyphosphate kinase
VEPERAPARPEPAVTRPEPSLEARSFINRELSSLAFNERVLEEACNPAVPLLERLKFLAIFSSNLDEFFMIRVAGLKQQLAGRVDETGPDALTPTEQLQAISRRCHALVARQERVFLEEVLPGLAPMGIRVLQARELATEPARAVEQYFEREILPVLTPIALDPGHPFPHLRHKSLNLVIRFAAPAGARLRYGVVPVPAVLPRLVPLAGGGGEHLLLEDVTALHVAKLFPKTPIEGCWPFRVTRNWDLDIDEEEAEDLLVTIEREVRRRDRGSAVRLQINAPPEEPASQFLARALKLNDEDVYHLHRPLALQEFVPTVLAREELKGLHDEQFTPALPAALGPGAVHLLESMRERDVLLHHPYESFEPVVSFIASAAEDPAVVAIKITLYRTGRDSPIVQALQRAAENGKQVTALIELKARMDEEANILWARELERAGVHVVYGLIGFKTHAKVALVVRRESGGLRRYVHVGTGNYNPVTGRGYSDLSLFTCDEGFGADTTSLFNLLTGYSRPQRWNKFLVAPLGLKASLLQLIAAEAKAGESGRIVAKLNALADPDVIAALCRASQAGAKIDLLVRGICCLRPGVPGVSERIRVTSVVDRFLEHSRIWHFRAGGEDKVFLASGDWMQRNFVRRVDLAFPIESPALKRRILDEILPTMLGDNQKAWVLRSDGRYERIVPGRDGTSPAPLRSQEHLMAQARKSVVAAGSRS